MKTWHRLRYLTLKAKIKSPGYKSIFYRIGVFKYLLKDLRNFLLFSMILIRYSTISDIFLRFIDDVFIMASKDVEHVY